MGKLTDELSELMMHELSGCGEPIQGLSQSVGMNLARGWSTRRFRTLGPERFEEIRLKDRMLGIELNLERGVGLYELEKAEEAFPRGI